MNNRAPVATSGEMTSLRLAALVFAALIPVLSGCELPALEGAPAASLATAGALEVACEINGAPAAAAVCDLEDGLRVVGDFREDRPTVIFVHGWIPSYELGVPDFVNADGWQRAGFNTIIYHFVQNGVDLGEGETCRVASGSIPILNLLEIACPKFSEQRTWRAGGITDHLVAEYQRFFSAYPGYRQEIRMVGHSLGGQIVPAAAHALTRDGVVAPAPTRVDLVDPWLGYEYVDTGKLTGELIASFPETQNRPGSRCNAGNEQTSYCAVENALTVLQQRGTAITVFGSNAAGAFAYDLRDFFHYQGFNINWLCSQFPFSERSQCLSRGYSMLTAQHFFPLFSYFWSINEPEPVNGLSAATPTAELLGPPTYRTQRNAGNYCNLPSGTPFWRKGGLDHVFGMSRYPGHLNDSVQDTADNQADLASRLVEFLGFDEANARQCARAISLANDVYDVR